MLSLHTAMWLTSAIGHILARTWESSVIPKTQFAEGGGPASVIYSANNTTGRCQLFCSHIHIIWSLLPPISSLFLILSRCLLHKTSTMCRLTEKLTWCTFALLTESFSINILILLTTIGTHEVQVNNVIYLLEWNSFRERNLEFDTKEHMIKSDSPQ